MNETLTFVDLHDAGNAQAQLVLYAIARHANWDTGRCWPGQTVLARMSKCSERTLRTYLKKLEADGLIKIDERRDEHGARQSDLITLVGYETWIKALRDGGKVEKPKQINAYAQPENIAGCLPENSDDLPEKNGGPTGKQVAAYKEPSLNNQLELDARARESSKIGVSSEVKSVAQFEITPRDPQWSTWIAHLRETDPDKATDAEASGSLTAAGSRWPDKGRLVFVQKATLSQRSKAMTGDVA